MTMFLFGLAIGFAVDHAFMGGENMRLVMWALDSAAAVFNRKADDLFVYLTRR